MTSITERIDAVTQISATHLCEAPLPPRSAKIELTGRCNYRCSFCALQTREGKPHDMDMGLFKRITHEMLEAGVEEIGVFYLGESFSAPDLLVEAVGYLKHELHVPYVFLTTNGSLANPRIVNHLMNLGLDSLKWSVNAADAEQFERVMGVKAALFDRALDNLKHVHGVRESHGYKTRIYASSIRYDGAQHEKMERLLDGRVRPFVDEHYWLPLYSMGAAAAEREAELGYRPIAGNQGRLDAMRDPLPCWSCFTEAHVTANGILSACCFDADGRWAMGDLKTTPFVEAWVSPEFRALRAAHLAKDVAGTPCEKCIAYA